MTNPFHKSLDWFRGRYVEVRSNDGLWFRGIVERVEHDMRHVVLKGADRLPPDGDRWEYVGAAFVSHADNWSLYGDGTVSIRPLHLDRIDPSPYHKRTFDPADNSQYIAQVHDREWAGSFPTVRSIGDELYECIAGDKRCWASRQAGLDVHPCIVRDYGDLAAATAFAFDHFPLPHTDGGRYDDEQVFDAALSMRDDFEEAIWDIWPVAWNLERLGIAPGQTSIENFEMEDT